MLDLGEGKGRATMTVSTKVMDCRSNNKRQDEGIFREELLREDIKVVFIMKKLAITGATDIRNTVIRYLHEAPYLKQ